jgi:threonine aldolase
MTPIVELRSDTFTRPSEAMRRAMAEAEVGDDVWNEDPTVHALERLAAEKTGKDAAVFVSSGTQGNLIGVLSHTQPGQEVLLGDRSHIFCFEVAGLAVVGGLQTYPLPNGDNGRLRPEDVEGAIRGADIHCPVTGCVALGNTHNRCGGGVIRPEDMAAVTEVAHAHSIPVHLDGARVFNAAVALGVPVRTLTDTVDSVSFCLSKGLGAPVGSVLCGSTDFIERARRWRKMLGGGMRQAGVLAAPGLIALEQNVDRLAEDHANAKRFAEGLAEIPGFRVDVAKVETNIVYFDVAGVNLDPDDLATRLFERGVRLGGGGTVWRAVTSSEVDSAGIEYALQVIGEVAAAAPVPV